MLVLLIRHARAGDRDPAQWPDDSKRPLTDEGREIQAGTGRARTPILALTANAMSHQVAEYLAAGADGHVSKPIDARQLFDAIDGAMRPGPSSEASSAA